MNSKTEYHPKKSKIENRKSKITVLHLVTLSPCHLVLALAALILLTPTLRAQNASTQPATTRWSATDTQKHAVEVPSDKPTLLIFLRPDQPQSTRIIDTLLASLKNRNDLQIIGLISGDDADLGTAKLTNAKWPWPIVADPDFAASGKFNVHVWPTTVLLSKSGSLITHIAGLPISYQNDLDAWLDFAIGKIDQAALDKRLTARETVADSAEQKAARHVEVAQRLASQSMKDAATAELAKALELKPTDPLLLLSIARTHLILADPKSAETLLATLKDPALPTGELNFLKAWAALQLGRWDDAKKILTDSIKLNPDPAESLYLLGLIAQHENNPKEAADYFRKAFEHTPTGKLLNK